MDRSSRMATGMLEIPKIQLFLEAAFKVECATCSTNLGGTVQDLFVVIPLPIMSTSSYSETNGAYIRLRVRTPLQSPRPLRCMIC